jgi:PAS domain S-box-containing protein
MASDVDQGQLLQQFVEDLPDCAVFILDAEGTVLTWNEGARSILGYAADEIVGRPLAALYAATATSSAPAEAMDDALARGRHEEAALLRHKDGRPLKVRSVLIPLYDARERHVGFGNLTRDLEGAPATAEAPPMVQDLAARRSAQQILVVDDDDQVRAVAVRQLTSLGYRVLAAGDGAEALELLDHVPDVDLLFVDVMMPNGMSGRECAQRAQAMRPGLAVLFASGYFEGALVQRGEIEGNTEFLVKPYRKKDLAEKVQQVLKSP